MGLITIIFTIFFTSNIFAYKNKLGIGITSSSYSKKIFGKSSTSSTKAKIVSNWNIHSGLELEYSITKYLRVLGSYASRPIEFNNSKSTINRDTSFNTSSMIFGLKWIVFSRTALRFLYNIEKDIGFEVAAGKTEIYSDNTSYLTVIYDQIIFLGPSIYSTFRHRGNSMYSGFRLGYDLGINGQRLSNKKVIRYGIFGVLNSYIGQFEAYFELKNITKDSSNYDFTEEDSILHITYRIIL
jgi:hypothetical protein